MTENPNTDYYKPSKGSLSGFDSIELPDGNVDIVKTGWSIEQLRAFLTNESGSSFPNEATIQSINDLVISHLNDFNNPHRVTLDQLDRNFVLDIFGTITPGNPPSIPPFFSFDSICALPLPDVFPATYSNTNFYRMNEGGTFINPSSETEILGVDYVTNVPGIPLFSNLTNVVPSDWATQPTTALKTVITIGIANAALPFNVYSVEETNQTGIFGVSIPITQAQATWYTLNFFLVSTITGGSVVIYQPSSPNDKMVVDLTTGDYTFSNANVTGEVFIYPSGIMRVSFGFISKTPDPDNAVHVAHLNHEETVLSRAGQVARPLFVICNPIATRSSLNHPVHINRELVGTCTTFVPTLSKVATPASLQNFILTFAVNIYPTVAGVSVLDTRILTFDTLSIERDSTNVYVKIAGTTIFTSAILRGLNVFTLSYSPTTIIFKDIATEREFVVGSYSGLSTAAMSFGPCGGYLKCFALYAISDTTKCLEYLTNG